jgi:hypothetical protein
MFRSTLAKIRSRRAGIGYNDGAGFEFLMSAGRTEVVEGREDVSAREENLRRAVEGQVLNLNLDSRGFF